MESDNRVRDTSDGNGNRTEYPLPVTLEKPANRNPMKPFLLLCTLSNLCCGLLVPPAILAESTEETDVVRVFIFAGQSNMVGSDSKVDDIQRFAPYAGLEKPQRHIRFSYSIGRES